MVKTKGYIALTDSDKSKSIQEEFKGQTTDIEVRFPKELGAEHPFKFEDMEKSFKKIGLVNGIVNLLKNSIVGDFQVKAKNENIDAFIKGFVDDTQFSSVLREWIKEGLLKGNGFIELDLKNNDLRVLNANDMYVKRNKKGKVLEYNQWLGNNFKSFNRDSNKLTPFKPNQIAHLKLNKTSNGAYGIGTIYPNERTITNIVCMEEDLHKLMKRKAGMPIHVKIGVPGESVQTEDIDAMSAKLQYMNNKTEWVTDGNIDMKLIDFSGIGTNLTETLDHDMQSLSTATNIPVVLFGKANVAEGLAKAQAENFQRYIESVREEIESIIEEKIFQPLLLANKFPDVKTKGLDKNAVGGNEKVEFIWNLPGEEEINKRIEKITQLLNNFGISENMKRMLQLELARLLDFDEADKYLMEPEAGLDEKEKQKDDEFKDVNLEKAKEPESKSPEAKKEAKIKQPETPGAKPNANAKHQAKIINKPHMHGEGCGQQLTESECGVMTMKEFVDLKEIDGFNYSEFLIKILQRLRIDKFELLAGLTEQDLIDGLLTQRDINKLRFILKDGFRKNKTMLEIETEIKNSISLKDRLKEGKVTLIAAARPTAIARSEVVRIANQGLLDTYKAHNIEKVRFLAALSERTCPICEGMNGQVFMLNEAEGMIPVHPMCRCSWLSVK